MVTTRRMVAERAVANLWPAWLVDVACRAGSTDGTHQEVDIRSDRASCAAVPSGASTGIYMVLMMRDGDGEKGKLLGKCILNFVVKHQ